MLNFTPQQMEALKLVSRQDYLLTTIPSIKAWIEKRHDTQVAHKNQPQGQQHLIEDCILHSAPYGFIRQTDIQQILDLQYQYHDVLYDQADLTPLHQAQWITPDDRISILTHLLKTKQQSGYYQPETDGNSLYNTADENRLEGIAASLKTAQATHSSSNDLAQYNAPLLQHAQAYHLLQQSLANISGWTAWQSDWTKAQLGIEQAQQKRRILLQRHKKDPNTAGNGEDRQLHASVDERDDIAVLLLKLPQQLETLQQVEIAILLEKWALQLYPVKKMQDMLDTETTPQGDAHA